MGWLLAAWMIWVLLKTWKGGGSVGFHWGFKGFGSAGQRAFLGRGA